MNAAAGAYCEYEKMEYILFIGIRMLCGRVTECLLELFIGILCRVVV